MESSTPILLGGNFHFRYSSCSKALLPSGEKALTSFYFVIMEVDCVPIQIPTEPENETNNNNRLDAGFAQEIEAYQELQLDFDSEFSDFLSRDLPDNQEPRVRRSSNPQIADHITNHRLEYNADGTVNCCDLNYGTLVRV